MYIYQYLFLLSLEVDYSGRKQATKSETISFTDRETCSFVRKRILTTYTIKLCGLVTNVINQIHLSYLHHQVT
jgi:hypothetical protein